MSLAQEQANKPILFHHMYIIHKGMIRLGWERQAALEALELPDPDSIPEDELTPMSRFLDVCNRACEANDDPLYCLRLGMRCHPADYGVLGQLAMYSANMEEAMKLVYRYQGLVNEVLTTSIVTTADSIISPLSIGDLDPEWVRPLVEFRFAATIHIGHFVTGDIYPDLFQNVSFQHKAADSPERYRKILGMPVRFEQARSSYTMPLHAINIPIFCADSDINRVLVNQAEKITASLGGSTLLRERVEQYIKQKLFLGVPSMDDCASHFGMSSTKFKRQLQSEGTHYQELCDQTRLSTITDLLLMTAKPINDIAVLSGFSHPSSLVRSFKRWTGKTPQQYRHHHKS